MFYIRPRSFFPNTGELLNLYKKSRGKSSQILVYIFSCCYDKTQKIIFIFSQEEDWVMHVGHKSFLAKIKPSPPTAFQVCAPTRPPPIIMNWMRRKTCFVGYLAGTNVLIFCISFSGIFIATKNIWKWVFRKLYLSRVISSWTMAICSQNIFVSSRIDWSQRISRIGFILPCIFTVFHTWLENIWLGLKRIWSLGYHL